MWNCIRTGLFLFFSVAQVAHAATLEIPGPGARLSGIGVISGWTCEAEGELTIRFNGGVPIPLAYQTERPDTQWVCHDTDNGFVAIMNWGNLGDGTHTAVAYDDGVEFARSTFQVVTLGETFVRHAEGSCMIQDFPDKGTDATFVWNEATQHLELDATDTRYDDLEALCEVAGTERHREDLNRRLNRMIGSWRITTYTSRRNPIEEHFRFDTLTTIRTATGCEPVVTGIRRARGREAPGLSATVRMTEFFTDATFSAIYPYQNFFVSGDYCVGQFFFFDDDHTIMGQEWLAYLEGNACGPWFEESSEITGTRSSF